MVDGSVSADRWDVTIWLLRPELRGERAHPNLPNGGAGYLHRYYGHREIFRGTSDDLREVRALWYVDANEIVLEIKQFACHHRRIVLDRTNGKLTLVDTYQPPCPEPKTRIFMGPSVTGAAPKAVDPPKSEYRIEGKCTRIPAKKPKRLL